jgi:hypothetical protein
MKKKTIFIIVGIVIFIPICLIVCCISFVFLFSKYKVYSEVNYFKGYKDEFIAVQKKYQNDTCTDGVESDIKIGSKEFDVYIRCSPSVMVFETGAIDGFNRVDYVYILNEDNVKEVDECSEGNGGYGQKLETNWHLCYGDWN